MKKALILLAILISTANCTISAPINTDAMLQYNQGIDFYKTGQCDNAIAAFREAIRLDPTYIDAYYNLGAVLEYMQQYEAALAVFRQVIVRQPNDFDSVYKAAWISYKLGQYDKAQTYLSIIPKNCPRATDAHELSLLIKEHDIPALKAPATIKATVNQTDNLYQNIAGPTGITTDSSGNLYVAGFNDNSIIKITPDGKKIIYAKDPKINGPIGLAIDNQGNIYVANYNKDNVLKISTLGEISVLISNVKKPYCLHIDGNMLFISCQGTDSVLRYKLRG